MTRSALKSTKSKTYAAPRPIGLDGQALRDRLTAIAQAKEGNDLALRADAMAELKQALSETLQDIRDRFEAGDLGGQETARHIAQAHDELLGALWDFTTLHVVRASNPTTSERLAMCAVGGYGRAEMSPGSDLDLLFLRAEKKQSAWSESVTEYILYMLWDLGLQVGQSSRTIEDCLSLAKEDHTIMTALLDGRYLMGDRDLVQDLQSRFRKLMSKATVRRGFVAAKLAEREERHQRYGNSRYVLEPNLKEGKGGLRDLHSLYWMASAISPDSKDIASPQSAETYEDLGLLPPKAAQRFVRAADFLWRARCHLHYLTGREKDTLTFDIQGEMARRMGHAKEHVEEAVEGFMREYFLNAREVGALTRMACAALEENHALKRAISLDGMLPKFGGRVKHKGLQVTRGRINFKSAQTLREHPEYIMDLFRVAGERNLDIHPDALAAISGRKNLIDSRFRSNPEIADTFFKILLDSKAPARVLELMNEAGVLGRYILEFGHIVARTQFNMHHVFTVDEHTLQLVENLSRLEQLPKEDAMSVQVSFMKKWTRQQRLNLYLAALLHDTGKGKGDQCVEGAKQARSACKRLGLDPEDVEMVAWLTRRHLDMSETAQRRDISDPETLSNFASIVGTQDRLQLLFVLTIIDIRSVGPGVWNDWKAQLLVGLYNSTRDYLAVSGEGYDLKARVSDASAACFDRLPEKDHAAITGWMDGFKASYWLGYSTADHLRHGRFIAKTLRKDKTTAAKVIKTREHDITELWIATRDRSGLFASLTAAMTHLGASIVGARLHTSSNGNVFDVFYLQNSEGFAFGRTNEPLLEKLKDRVEKAAEKDVVLDEAAIARFPSARARAIPVPIRIEFDSEARGRVHFVEVEGRDRPGLLAALARAFNEKGVAVLSAHIEVIGERAVDTFYIVPAGRDGELTRADLDDLGEALRRVLEGPAT